MNEKDLLECDVVMKGGVTSGVVYPSAVAALSKTYRFRNIGGTSAGAIGSVVTAAAEYSRQTGTGSGFEGLAGLPSWLASQGHLFGLFKPNRTTRPGFAFLSRLLASPQGQNKLVAAIVGLFSSYKWISLASTLPGIIVAWVGVRLGQPWMLAIGVALGLALPIGLPLYLLFRCIADEVPRNFYGLCTGLDESDPNNPTTLTSWLADFIDVVAGVEKRSKPLTFGDLWSAGLSEELGSANPRPDNDQDAYRRDEEREARAINLEMITTNITHGRPYRFPFDTSIFYFHPEEFRKLFPPRIVDWMVANPRTTTDPQEAARMQSALPRLPLPRAADLPVVVGARMSLSFPFLLSAVPLHAVDWSRPSNQKNRTSPKFEHCWFSDGGLSSNFPIHLFDAPIPTRPTFGIDLQAFPEEFPESQADQCANVWMPRNNEGGILPSWVQFDDSKPNLGGFFGTVVNAMQNWQDTMQSEVPGFRDRIAHVYLSSDEGGLNLDMSADLLDRLSARGTCAGDLIVKHFREPNPVDCSHSIAQPTNWNNHCVVRYRTAMALLENWIRRLCGSYTPSYAALMDRSLGSPPCSYPWHDEAQRTYARNAIRDIVQLDTGWLRSGQTFAQGVPRPQPELSTRPRA